MSEQKYTPGPWSIDGPSMGFASLYNADGKFVFALAAPTAEDRIPKREVEANAALIAAAPELLEACIAMRDHYGQDEFVKACDKMEAAIRKATT